MKRYIYWIVVFLTILNSALAEREYYFKQISLEEGLSGTTVKCVTTDYKGLLWIGTPSGLNSFDREQIRVYNQNKNDPYSLPGNEVDFVVEDSLLNLWVATDRGLALYDRDNDRFIPIEQRGQILHVRAYILLKDGLLLFGRKEVFKYSYADRKIESLPLHAKTNMSSFFDEGYMYTPNKVILACRWNGLWLYDIQTGNLDRLPFVKEMQIASIYVDDFGHLWVSPYGKGLMEYDQTGKLLTSLTYPEQLTNGVILDIKERNSQLWLATDGGGINVYDRKSGSVQILQHVSGKFNSLPVNSFRCLYNDADNNMWAGSIRGGLIGMKEVYMKTYKDAPLNSAYGLSDKTVIAMYEDSDGLLWLGTDGGGLNRLDPAIKQFRHYPATFDTKVVSIIDYNEKELLLSLFNKGLYLFNKQSGLMREYPVAGKERYTRIFCQGLSVNLGRLDKDHFCLFADSAYLYDQSDKRLISFKVGNADITTSSLNVMCSDSQGCYVWNVYNLLYINNNAKTVESLYNRSDSIGDISTACRDSEGLFWIGTTTGLFRYDPVKKQLSTINTKQFQEIRTVGFDRSGYLWVGTRNALYAYTPKDQKFVICGESDGVYANEYITKSPLLTHSGDIYLGGVMGLVAIHNKILFPETPDPSISLLDVLLDGVSIASKVSREGSAITLPWNYTSLSARVIAMEKDLMRKKKFRYYIKGKQEEVIESSNHAIAFHSLSAGQYQVWVSCNKKNGNWSTPVKLLSITVLPPWWKRDWFICCSILFVLAVAGTVSWLIVRNKGYKMVWAMKEHEQKVNEEKIRFLINLNHELRTPLTLIYAPLKRILKSGEIKNEDHFGQLTEILKQTRRIENIVNMVLDVRKMEVGGEKLDIREYDLNAWMQNTAEAFNSELISRNIRLVYELDTTIGLVPFDAAKHEIILSNLLMNAMKFSDSGTCITLSAKLIDNSVRISVSDQGIGLDNVDTSKLFTRFYQGEHNKKGTGLGLSYAQLLVEMHGGRIDAMSNADRGATFFYELPKRNKTLPIEAKPYLNELLVSSEQKRVEVTDFSVDKYSVLIVEDEPELRNYLRKMLKGCFKEVYVAGDGVEGLEMITRNMPDLVVSDVIMPRMDGFELCKHIKTSLSIGHIPVLLLTSQTDAESTMQGYKLGADMYVAKPFDLDFLLTVMQNQLKNREVMKIRYKENQEIVCPVKDTISNIDEEFFRKLNALIHENIENPDLDVNFVASHMAMSRTSLYNKLKQLLDVSIGDYIQKYRMVRAMELLADPNLSILEVSEKAGFANQRYFSTAFKQIYHVSPSKYRQEHFM